MVIIITTKCVCKIVTSINPLQENIHSNLHNTARDYILCTTFTSSTSLKKRQLFQLEFECIYNLENKLTNVMAMGAFLEQNVEVSNYSWLS